MEAGQLRERITLQQRTSAVAASGEDIYTWADFAEVFAFAEPLRGREFFAAVQAQSSVDVKFTIRWRNDIDSTMRVMWRSQPYEIDSAPINPKGARVWLELMCVKGIRDGR